MASSWETKAINENKVLLATISPPGGMVSYQWARAWKDLKVPPESDALVVQGLPYGVARNYAVKTLLDQGFPWLFFLDSDMILPPDAIMRLLETKAALIGCYYTHRFPPYEPCFYGAKVKTKEGAWRYGSEMIAKAHSEKTELQKVAITGWHFGDIVPVAFMPAGACLIHQSVFAKMLKEGISKPYQWTMDIDNPNGLSEDYSMSIKALSVGTQPYVHTGIQGLHECLATCGVRGIEAVTQ